MSYEVSTSRLVVGGVSLAAVLYALIYPAVQSEPIPERMTSISTADDFAEREWRQLRSNIRNAVDIIGGADLPVFREDARPGLTFLHVDFSRQYHSYANVRVTCEYSEAATPFMEVSLTKPGEYNLPTAAVYNFPADHYQMQDVCSAMWSAAFAAKDDSETRGPARVLRDLPTTTEV